MIMEMKYDKRNGNIAFRDSDHRYMDLTDPGKKFISVTTLIGKYEQKFDLAWWSQYKSLERLIPKDKWAIEKKMLLAARNVSDELLEMYDISRERFNTVQQEILDEWAKKNLESRERGTKIHSEIESQFYNNPKNIDVNKFGIGGKFECRKDYTLLDLDYAVYPEYLIHYTTPDGKLNIAGQIDLLIKSHNTIICVDHKTNAEIKKKSYYNKNTGKSERMQYPLNNLDDVNFWHYTLQLSTYAYMLQQLNPDFEIKDLIINHYDHNGNNDIYHCDYLKDDVIRMINHYKKQLEIQESRKKREKIEY